MLFSAGRTADGRSLIPWGEKSKPGCRQLPGRHDDDCPAKQNVKKCTATRNNKQQTIRVWRISQRRSCHRDNHSKPVNFTVAYFQRNSLRETLLSCCSYSRIATRLQCRPHVAVLQCERDDGSKTSETDVAMNSSDLENDFIGKSLSITGWWF